MDLNQRASGVLLHVTSLPGPHGIGDFGPGAYHFADWLAGAGQRLWQWLPTTPIGPGDSPYQSVSAFAGSPLMVALEPLVVQAALAPAPEADPSRYKYIGFFVGAVGLGTAIGLTAADEADERVALANLGFACGLGDGGCPVGLEPLGRADCRVWMT